MVLNVAGCDDRFHDAETGEEIHPVTLIRQLDEEKHVVKYFVIPQSG